MKITFPEEQKGNWFMISFFSCLNNLICKLTVPIVILKYDIAF